MKKTRLALIGTLTLALAVFVTACSGPDRSYESFSLLMDKVAGAGNWSAQSHEAKGGTLTVKGLSLKLHSAMPQALLDELKPAAAPEAQTASGQAPAAAGEATAGTPAPAAEAVSTLDIATVEVKKMIDKEALDKLLATTDWKNVTETKLADDVVLKGIVHLEKALPGYELKMEEAGLKSIALGAANGNAPAGAAGFLKALRLGSLTYKNYTFKNEVPEVKMEGVVKEASIEEVKFDGPAMTGLEPMDPTGLITVMSGMTAKKTSLGSMSIRFAGGRGGGDGQGTFSLDSAEALDAKGFGAIGSLTMNGLKFEVVSSDQPMDNPALTPKILFSLDKVESKGFDMNAYLQRFMPIVAAAQANPEQAEQLFSRFQTLGDLFVAPMSLDEITVSGLEMNLFDLVGLKLAEAKMTGPYAAGQIPAKQKSHVKGFEINISDDPAKFTGSGQEFFEILKAFGMHSFKIEAEGEGDYDPQTGVLSRRTNRLVVEDLMEMSGRLDLSGLTAERLEVLKNTPLTMIYMAMMAPDAVLGDVALDTVNIKIIDHSLVDRIFKAVAASAAQEGREVTAEQLRTQTAAALQLMLTLRGAEFMEKPEELARTLASFLEQPQSLEINLAAQPPFGLKSVMSMEGDYNRILNSLNLSVASNGNPAQPIKFAIAGVPTAAPAPQVDLDEEDAQE